MQLVIDLKDDAKLSLVLEALKRLVTSEGVDLTIGKLERIAVLESSAADFDWAKFDEVMSRDKLRPGQPEMSPEEEEEWIAQEIKAMRAEERIPPAI